MDDRTHDPLAAYAGESADTGTTVLGQDREIEGAGDTIGEGDAFEGNANLEAEAQREHEMEAAAARVEQAVRDYRVGLQVAAQSIDRAIGEAIAVSALLTWSPGREEEIHRRVAAAVQNLAVFGTRMAEASAARAHLAASDQVLDRVSDHDDHYGGTLDAFREARRQMDGLIAVLGSDVCNTPALVATARATIEAEYAANVRARGLSVFLERLGVAT